MTAAAHEKSSGVSSIELFFDLVFVFAAALALPAAVQAAVGVTEIASKDGDPVTVFYPSSAEEKALKRGPFTLHFAPQGAPVRGNGRLVVVSHGSGGAPWPHSDLARALVESGFVVAAPEHRGDNYKDMSAVGPESWKRRPAEVSRAIDAVGQDARCAPPLARDKVGMFGMSAGGATAPSLVRAAALHRRAGCGRLRRVRPAPRFPERRPRRSALAFSARAVRHPRRAARRPAGLRPLRAPRGEPQDRGVLPRAPAPWPATIVWTPRMIEFGRGLQCGHPGCTSGGPTKES